MFCEKRKKRPTFICNGVLKGGEGLLGRNQKGGMKIWDMGGADN